MSMSPCRRASDRAAPLASTMHSAPPSVAAWVPMPFPCTQDLLRHPQSEVHGKGVPMTLEGG